MKPFSSRERLELALTRINDPKGEGAKACLTVYTEAARAAADAGDIEQILDADDHAIERAERHARFGAGVGRANSVMLVLATITAPPARRRRTTGASAAAG